MLHLGWNFNSKGFYGRSDYFFVGAMDQGLTTLSIYMTQGVIDWYRWFRINWENLGGQGSVYKAFTTMEPFIRDYFCRRKVSQVIIGYWWENLICNGWTSNTDDSSLSGGKLPPVTNESHPWRFIMTNLHGWEFMILNFKCKNTLKIFLLGHSNHGHTSLARNSWFFKWLSNAVGFEPRTSQHMQTNLTISPIDLYVDKYSDIILLTILVQIWNTNLKL